MTLLFIIILCSPDAYTQSNTVDSLKKTLERNKGGEDEIRTWLSLGEIYDNENHIDSAIMAYQKAMLIASTIHDRRTEATALLNVGILTTILGNYGEGISLLFSSLHIYEEIEEADGITGAHMYLQAAYRHAGDYGNALRHAFIVKNRVEKNDKRGTIIFPGTRMLPLVLAEIGETYQHMNELDSAEFYSRKSIDERLMFYGASWNFPIYLLGKIQAKQGKYKEALANYKVAIPLAIQNRFLKDTLDVYNSIAELYMNTGELDSAIYYGKSIVNKRFLNINILLKAETTLAAVYKLKHNTDSAYKYLELSSVLKDSIYSAKKQKEYQSAIFNQQLREQESAQQQQRLKSQVIMYSLIAGLIIILIIALLLYRSNMHKQSAKQKIEKAFDDLKATQKQLIQSEKMASLGELTAGIAHEIQNPLNFVNNFSEVNEELLSELKGELSKGKMDDAIALANNAIENQKKINHHGKRADAIVKGMLQHSRTSSGTKEPTDINALCDEYLRLSYHGLRAKDKTFNAKFETDFDPTVEKINVIPQDIGRVILNLINNAFYAVTEKRNN